MIPCTAQGDKRQDRPTECRENHLQLHDFLRIRPNPKLIKNVELAQKYLKSTRSAQQLAEEFGVSKQMILGRLRQAGVHGKNSRRANPENFSLPNPAYGYRVRNGRLETNPVEMKVARLIVELRDRQKLSFEEITEELSKRGRRNRRGGAWYRASVRQVYRKWAGKI